MNVFSPSSPESSLNPSRGEWPLPPIEVFSASSRTRDSIPENYRAHFDGLIDNILAFGKEFSIPTAFFDDPDALRTHLVTHKIPNNDLERFLKNYQALEYLITHKEPMKEDPTEALEYTERLYHLREQYTSQVTLLEQVGILKEGVITGIDEEVYPIPTLEQIAQRFCDPERKDFFTTKREQKFIKLLLVPFGMSLDSLIGFFQYFLLQYHEKHPEFDLDINEPAWVGDSYQDADAYYNRGLRYFPRFIEDGEHQGKTKLHLLHEEQKANSIGSISGWRILFFQAPHDEELGFRHIPKELDGYDEGIGVIRSDLEANKTPEEYFAIFENAKKDPTNMYYGESGMTPEDWIIAFMVHLQETGMPLDDFLNHHDSECYLACINERYLLIPRWDREKHQVELNALHRSGISGALNNIGTRLVIEV